jgi:hypothetical protein
MADAVGNGQGHVAGGGGWNNRGGLVNSSNGGAANRDKAVAQGGASQAPSRSGVKRCACAGNKNFLQLGRN